MTRLCNFLSAHKDGEYHTRRPVLEAWDLLSQLDNPSLNSA